jgi:hypothetical protein
LVATSELDLAIVLVDIYSTQLEEIGTSKELAPASSEQRERSGGGSLSA